MVKESLTADNPAHLYQQGTPRRVVDESIMSSATKKHVCKASTAHPILNPVSYQFSGFSVFKSE